MQNWFSSLWFFVCRDSENRKPYLWFFAFWFRNPQNPVFTLLSVKSVGLFAARVYPPRSGVLLFAPSFAISDLELQARGFFSPSPPIELLEWVDWVCSLSRFPLSPYFPLPISPLPSDFCSVFAPIGESPIPCVSPIHLMLL